MPIYISRENLAMQIKYTKSQRELRRYAPQLSLGFCDGHIPLYEILNIAWICIPCDTSVIDMSR